MSTMVLGGASSTVAILENCSPEQASREGRIVVQHMRQGTWAGRQPIWTASSLSRLSCCLATWPAPETPTPVGSIPASR